MYLGDRNPGDLIDFVFNTVDAGFAPITLVSGALAVYKGNGTGEDSGDITLTTDFDSRTGLHHVRIDTSADPTFYAAGNDFFVVLTAGTVDGVSVVGQCVGHFSLQNRNHLRPTTAGRTLDVSSGGEAGVDWANVGSPTTTVNLSGTTVKDATDVETKLGSPAGASVSADVAAVKAQTAAIETDTQDIQGRLPAALTGGGNIKADALALNGSTTGAANIAKTTAAIARGTVGNSASTTSIPTSAFSPAGAAADQFKGRIVTFDSDTATAALRGQSTDITASSNSATPTLTVTALTTAPAAGDTFSVT